MNEIQLRVEEETPISLDADEARVIEVDDPTVISRLAALEAKIPDPPTTNGTYWLGCQVTNNGVEYFWDIPAAGA